MMHSVLFSKIPYACNRIEGTSPQRPFFFVAQNVLVHLATTNALCIAETYSLRSMFATFLFDCCSSAAFPLHACGNFCRVQNGRQVWRPMRSGLAAWPHSDSILPHQSHRRLAEGLAGRLNMAGDMACSMV